MNGIFLLIMLFFGTSCSRTSDTVTPVTKQLEIKGADLSFLPEVRQSGLVFRNAGNQAEDMLLTLKKAGLNTVRIRLWKNPAMPTSSFAAVKALAQEVKSMGMKVLLTVHYSDDWADPGKQTKPAQWTGISFQQLTDSVYAYTKKIVSEINPDYIQIGNEINNGLLWPEGSYSNLAQMKQLLQKAISAVRETNTNTRIVLHYAGHDNANAFFNSLGSLDYDIIGISYYPNWHGKDLDALQQHLIDLGNTQNKPVFIAEASYPFTFGWNDNTNNIIGGPSQILPAYPPTPAGQKDYLLKLRQLITAVPKGMGFCYWGGEWVSYNGATATNGSTWENQAFWDFNNNALPVLEAFK